MKKKIAVLLLLVLVVTFALTGCNMVTLNKQVDDAIIVANVNYEGLHDTVTKKELKEMFASQGQLYIYYYGWTPERAYDFCVEALAQQKLSKLKALDELCKEHNEKFPNDKWSAAEFQNSIVDHLSFEEGTTPSKKTIFDNILFVDEKISVVKNYNKQMKEAIDSLIKEIEKEELLNKEDEEEETPDEDTPEEEKNDKEPPAIREVRPAEEEKTPEIKADSEYNETELADKNKELKDLKRFEVQWKADMKALETEIENLEAQLKAAAEADKAAIKEQLDEKTKEYEHKEKAFSRLSTRLEKNGTSRNKIFEDIVDNMLISHYRLVVVGKEKTAINDKVDAADAAKKQEIIDANKAEFITKNTTSEKTYDLFLESKYEAAIKGGSPVYYNPIVKNPVKSNPDTTKGEQLGSAGYAYTFNILLNFNKNDAEMLKQLKAKADQTGNIKDKALYEKKLKEYAERIKVNISNPYYDSTKECADGIKGQELDKKDADGKYLYKDEYGYHKCSNPDCKLKPFGYDVKDTYDSVLTQEEKEQVKVGYDVPVLTVLKMINYDLVQINEDTTIKDPYLKQVKLREAFIQWMYKVNDDPGMFSKDNAKGYMLPKAGDSSFVESYTNQSRELMGADLADPKKPKYANPTYNEGNKHFVGNYRTNKVEAKTDDLGTLKEYGDMIAISEYGIHIIMISEMPGYYQDENHILLDDAPFTYGRSEYTKVADSFRDQVRKYEESKVYEVAVKDLVKNYDNYVTVDKNAYKKLYEEA